MSTRCRASAWVVVPAETAMADPGLHHLRPRGRRSPPSPRAAGPTSPRNRARRCCGSARTTAPPCTFSRRPWSCRTPRSRRIVMSETPHGGHEVLDPHDAVALQLGQDPGAAFGRDHRASRTTATPPAGTVSRPSMSRSLQQLVSRGRRRSRARRVVDDEDPAVAALVGPPGDLDARSRRRRDRLDAGLGEQAADEGVGGGLVGPAGDVPGRAGAVRVPGHGGLTCGRPVDVRRDGLGAGQVQVLGPDVGGPAVVEAAPARRCAAGRNSSARTPSRSRKAPG